MENELLVKNLFKTFLSPSGNGKISVLENIHMQIGKGEFVSILGPSGCGKSTLLNILMDFIQPDHGNIIYNNLMKYDFSIEKGIIFQSPTLFPWLTAMGNIEYGLKRKKVKEELIKAISKKMIHLVGLEGFEKHYPYQLSGGMQQRIALARMLVMKPQIMFMDEPFAALDAQIRLDMQQLLLQLWQEFKPTILFVTHDIEEALYLSDRIYIMSSRPGSIVREIKIPFPRPRNIDSIGEYEFLSLKRQIFQDIQRKKTPQPLL